MAKETNATLWIKDGKYGITLYEPIYMKDPGEVKVLKKIKLPLPMTSNKFNEFIKSDEGSSWAKKEFEKVV